MNEGIMIDIETISPETYAQICPNCRGRGTVGLNPVRPCPSCAHTDHPGVVYLPVRMKEQYGKSGLD